MIIYNVTIKVEHGIASQWLDWIQRVHIPEVLATDCFTEARILRLIEVDETEGPTYAIQYSSINKENYNRYIEEFSEDMRKKTTDKWGNQYIAFRSVLEVVN